MYDHIISRKIIGYHEIQYFLKVLNLINKEIFVQLAKCDIFQNSKQ